VGGIRLRWRAVGPGLGPRIADSIPGRPGARPQSTAPGFLHRARPAHPCGRAQHQGIRAGSRPARRRRGEQRVRFRLLAVPVLRCGGPRNDGCGAVDCWIECACVVSGSERTPGGGEVDPVGLHQQQESMLQRRVADCRHADRLLLSPWGAGSPEDLGHIETLRGQRLSKGWRVGLVSGGDGTFVRQRPVGAAESRKVPKALNLAGGVLSTSLGERFAHSVPKRGRSGQPGTGRLLSRRCHERSPLTSPAAPQRSPAARSGVPSR
jgi:hypothetical protein